MVNIARRQLILQGSAALASMAVPCIPLASTERAEVDLALVLAVDISRSISWDEHRIQLDGYAAAFWSDELVDTITRGPNGAVAVTLLQWAGSAVGIQRIGWTLIRDRSSAEKFAGMTAAIPYEPEWSTSIGGAIRSAMRLFAELPYRPLRRVIDVSGDGISIEAGLLAAERALAVAAAITINGLPICTNGKRVVADFYASEVIGGPGAFLVVAKDFASFPGAIRRKLTLEIASKSPPAATTRA